MRALILTVVMLLAGANAAAQAVPPPSCWPAKFGPLTVPGGTGTPVINGAIPDLGVWWSWRCPDGSVAFKAALDAWKGPPLSTLAMEFMTHQSVFDALIAIWLVYDTPQAACTPADPCDAGWLNLAADAKSAAAALPLPDGTPPPPPPPPSWVTSGLSTYYSAAGALSGFAGIGTRGAACDCALPINAGATSYCTFQGAPGPHVVAACKQVAP
jgi:hypothetical protein